MCHELKRWRPLAWCREKLQYPSTIRRAEETINALSRGLDLGENAEYSEERAIRWAQTTTGKIPS